MKQLLATFWGVMCVTSALFMTTAFNGHYAHWAWPLGGAAVLLFLFALTTPPQK